MQNNSRGIFCFQDILPAKSSSNVDPASTVLFNSIFQWTIIWSLTAMLFHHCKKVYQEHCYMSLNVDFKMGFCSSSGSKREKVWMYADFLSALWMMNLICISDFCCKLQVHLHSNKTNIPPSTFTEIQIWMTEII